MAGMVARRWLALSILVGALGCAVPASNRSPDAGAGATDGGDRGGPPDAGDRPADAGGLDSGAADCACPALPASCDAPATGTPVFTPPAEAMLEQIFHVIACAESSLQIAMYEAEWPCIGEAIAAALARNPGLTVEVVADDERCAPGSCIFDDLPAGRATIVRDARSAYMHHKFVIADGERVWVGSANFSERSFCIDHNNSLILDHAEIVDAYEALFAELAGGGFEPMSRTPRVSEPYALYVSPDSPTTAPADWQTDILAAIDAAGSGSRIGVMMNAWTITEFATALVAARDEGASVRVLVSHTYANDPPAQTLLEAGVEIRRDSIHDKVIVIDDVVFTGSANWSANARSNNENVLRIEDAALAAAYHAEVDRVFASARTIDRVAP